MSVTSDRLESKLANVFQNSTHLPDTLPQWLRELGVREGARIISSTRVGASLSKTDVLVTLEDSANIKISAKLSNADYFGNWYGHQRFLEEFGQDKFDLLTQDATKWANQWINHTSNLFVGVSICFGRRSGNTARRFLDIFSPNDILSVVKGVGNEDDDSIANSIYVSSNVSSNLEETLTNLNPINLSTVEVAAGDFQIAYRPINPLTEGSNRSKNVYTQFVPYGPANELIEVSKIEDLRAIGQFYTVEANRLNHNQIIRELREKYNIQIPTK